MKYCSECGSDKLQSLIPVDDHRPRLVCGECETIHYENPKIIVGCLVLNAKGEILLARRGIEPRLGFWNLPAGFLENDEGVEQGALREVLEETGAQIEISQLHSVYNLLKAQQVYLFFRAKMLNDHVETTPESTEIKFFAPEDIPWNELAFSSNAHALKHWLSILGGGKDELNIGTLNL